MKLSEKSFFLKYKPVTVTVQDNKLTINNQTKCKAVLDFSQFQARLQIVSRVEFKITFQLKSGNQKHFVFQSTA
jgi:hypothetical protein